jgi:hypothetical protein
MGKLENSQRNFKLFAETRLNSCALMRWSVLITKRETQFAL